jgi:hypothetical protein
VARPTAADRRAAIRYGPSVRRIAQRYRNPYTGKRLSGAALLLKVASGESGFNDNAVSSAGARGRTQFMPATRAAVLKQFGVDPWGSVDDAYHATALHLRGKLGNAKGLEGYNPGDPSYTSYILKQKVGKIRGAPGGTGGAASGVSGTPGTPGSVGAQNLPMGSTGALDALAALAQQPAAPPPSALPAPSFAAAPVLPKGYQAVQSGGGPEPKVDVNSLLEQIRTPGGDVQLAPGVPGTAGALGTQGLTTGRGTGGGKGDAFVAAVRQEAQHISQAKVPYSWGGGHGRPQKAGSKVTPLDCSGAVSRVLGVNPRVSGDFEKWGKPGRGRVTVYANKTHVLMEIDGHFWGTSASNPGGGAGWIPRSKISQDYLRNFTARHA